MIVVDCGKSMNAKVHRHTLGTYDRKQEPIKSTLMNIHCKDRDIHLSIIFYLFPNTINL